MKFGKEHGNYVPIAPGEKRHRLIFLYEKEEKVTKGMTVIACKCECGAVTSLFKTSFLSGATKSCGCLHREKAVLNGMRKRGVYGRSLFKNVFWFYKKSAKNRGYPFLLQEDYFYELTQQPCFYCGAAPCMVRKSLGKYGEFVYNGIDRVDNAKGYEVGNVVSCCKMCQYAKRDYTVEDFLGWAKRLATHQTMLSNGSATEITQR